MKVGVLMLGKRIYELRKELNISQEEFAVAINTSRQSVSKWELGDSFPEVNKLKDIASFFNVSIDYLLDYDIENTSCEEFINRLKTAIKNKVFDITLKDIKYYVSRFNNVFELYAYSADYLFVMELERQERNLLDIIITYFKKAILLFDKQKSEITLNDIHSLVVQTYIVYKEYDLAMDYMEQYKVYDDRSLAECNYRLKKYNKTSNIVSNIYLSAISNILSSSHLQIRILLKQNKYNESYELANWVINLIDSVSKSKCMYTAEKVIYLFLKAVCEKVIKIDNKNTINELKELVKIDQEGIVSYDTVKFYYNEPHATYNDINDYKSGIKAEILEDKDEYLDLYNEVFKEVFGGDLNE